MAKKQYTILEGVKLFLDIDLTRLNGVYSFRVHPRGKGQLINPYGGVFGMKKLSVKNNINLVLARLGRTSTFRYSFVVEGKVVYFETKENILK